MSFLKRLLGLKDPLTPKEKGVQAKFLREEQAAQAWQDDYDREGESQDNVANVGKHELLLSIFDKSINDNVLTGVQCPHCGSQGPFVMAVTRRGYATVSDDGFDDFIGEE